MVPTPDIDDAFAPDDDPFTVPAERLRNRLTDAPVAHPAFQISEDEAQDFLAAAEREIAAEAALAAAPDATLEDASNVIRTVLEAQGATRMTIEVRGRIGGRPFTLTL